MSIEYNIPNVQPAGGGQNVIAQITNADSPYAVGSTIRGLFIFATTAGSDTQVNLPAATGSGHVIYVKKTDAAAFKVQLHPNGADTIDGVNANYAVSTQNETRGLIDYASGKWAVII